MDEKATVHTEEIEASVPKTVTLDGDVVLVSHHGLQQIPLASNDPNDPLNFPKWRKWGIVLSCCWFSIFSIMSLSGLGAIFQSLFGIYAATHTPAQIVGLSTYPTMVMTLGSLVLLPLAFVIGRRPVFLLAVTICLVCFIIAGASKTFDGHFISRIFIGLASGTTETLLPLIIADCSFLNERNFFFGLYWATQNIVSAVILIAIPYLVASLSWRWYYWFFVITMGATFILAALFLPETRFRRPPLSLTGRTIYTDDFGHTHILTIEEARERFGEDFLNATEDTPPPKRTFLQELSPYNGYSPNPRKTLTTAYVKIGKAATNPGVIFALLLSSIVLGTGIAITLVYSTLLETSFHWKPSSVGLFNIGSVPGSFLAMLYTGWIGEKLNLYLAKKNNGVHIPEHALINLIFPCVVAVLGLVAIAVPANSPANHSAWAMVVGWALFQFGFICVLIISTTFAAEIIPESPGAAMVVVVGGKNLVAFGAAQGIIPMVAKFSYLTSIMILLGIFLAIALLGIPVYFLSKTWRKRFAATHVHVSDVNLAA